MYKPQLIMSTDNLVFTPVSLPCGYTLRPFQKGDEQSWIDICSEAFNSDFEWKNEFREGALFFACDESGTPVACAGIRLAREGEPDPTRAYLHFVACKKAHGGKGLGKAVVVAALTAARELYGFKGAVLTTDDERIFAIKLYLSLGFTPVYNSLSYFDRWNAIYSALGIDKNAWYEAEAATKKAFETDGYAIYPDNYVIDPKSDCIPKLLAYPATGTKTSIIVCRGGGYGGKAYHEGALVCEFFRKNGISAFLLDYRVAPCTHPTQLNDVQRAIRWLRKNSDKFGISPDRIGVIGFSAGGHLASMAATLFDGGKPESTDEVERFSSRPDYAVLSYAVISLISYTNEGTAHNLLGSQYSIGSCKALSGELNVTAQTPPCFIWHTANDDGVPVENSLQFATALSANEIPFELHIFPKGPHGIGLGDGYEGAEQWKWLCLKWLDTLFK